MHWVSAGLVLYSFAAPSSIGGVAYTFAHAGRLLGSIFGVVSTAASMGGALLLLEVVLACPRSRQLRTLSDVGAVALGPTGATCALVLQMLNFLLYMPVAMLTTAQALQDATQPDGRTCTSYIVFGVALLCFVVTQSRDFDNASLLAGIALAAALCVAALQVAVVLSAPAPAASPERPPPPLVGAPAGSGVNGAIELALSLTTCVWSYVPSLLVAELAHEMASRGADPRDLRRAIALSGGLTAWSKWRLGGAVAGCHQLARLHLEAWGCPRHSRQATHQPRSNREAATLEPGRAKLTDFAALDHTGLNLLVFLAVGLSVATAWGEGAADPFRSRRCGRVNRPRRAPCVERRGPLDRPRG